MNGARVPEFESAISQRKIDLAKCDKNQSSPFRVLQVVMVNAIMIHIQVYMT